MSSQQRLDSLSDMSSTCPPSTSLAASQGSERTPFGRLADVDNGVRPAEGATGPKSRSSFHLTKGNKPSTSALSRLPGTPTPATHSSALYAHCKTNPFVLPSLASTQQAQGYSSTTQQTRGRNTDSATKVYGSNATDSVVKRVAGQASGSQQQQQAPSNTAAPGGVHLSTQQPPGSEVVALCEAILSQPWGKGPTPTLQQEELDWKEQYKQKLQQEENQKRAEHAMKQTRKQQAVGLLGWLGNRGHEIPVTVGTVATSSNTPPAAPVMQPAPQQQRQQLYRSEDTTGEEPITLTELFSSATVPISYQIGNSPRPQVVGSEGRSDRATDTPTLSLSLHGNIHYVQGSPPGTPPHAVAEGDWTAVVSSPHSHAHAAAVRASSPTRAHHPDVNGGSSPTRRSNRLQRSNGNNTGATRRSQSFSGGGGGSRALLHSRQSSRCSNRTEFHHRHPSTHDRCKQRSVPYEEYDMHISHAPRRRPSTAATRQPQITNYHTHNYIIQDAPARTQRHPPPSHTPTPPPPTSFVVNGPPPGYQHPQRAQRQPQPPYSPHPPHPGSYPMVTNSQQPIYSQPPQHVRNAPYQPPPNVGPPQPQAPTPSQFVTPWIEFDMNPYPPDAFEASIDIPLHPPQQVFSQPVPPPIIPPPPPATPPPDAATHPLSYANGHEALPAYGRPHTPAPPPPTRLNSQPPPTKRSHYKVPVDHYRGPESSDTELDTVGPTMAYHPTATMTTGIDGNPIPTPPPSHPTTPTPPLTRASSIQRVVAPPQPIADAPQDDVIPNSIAVNATNVNNSNNNRTQNERHNNNQLYSSNQQPVTSNVQPSLYEGTLPEVASELGIGVPTIPPPPQPAMDTSLPPDHRSNPPRPASSLRRDSMESYAAEQLYQQHQQLVQHHPNYNHTNAALVAELQQPLHTPTPPLAAQYHNTIRRASLDPVQWIPNDIDNIPLHQMQGLYRTAPVGGGGGILSLLPRSSDNRTAVPYQDPPQHVHPSMYEVISLVPSEHGMQPMEATPASTPPPGYATTVSENVGRSATLADQTGQLVQGQVLPRRRVPTAMDQPDCVTPSHVYQPVPMMAQYPPFIVPDDQDEDLPTFDPNQFSPHSLIPVPENQFHSASSTPTHQQPHQTAVTSVFGEGYRRDTESLVISPPGEYQLKREESAKKIQASYRGYKVRADVSRLHPHYSPRNANYQPIKGLRIQLLSGSDLVGPDMTCFTSPYVTFKVGSERRESSIRRAVQSAEGSDVHPPVVHWDETIFFTKELPPNGDLHVIVCEGGLVTDNTTSSTTLPLCQYVYPLKAITNRDIPRRVSVVPKIPNKASKTGWSVPQPPGVLHLEITALSATPVVGRRESLLGTNSKPQRRLESIDLDEQSVSSPSVVDRRDEVAATTIQCSYRSHVAKKEAEKRKTRKNHIHLLLAYVWHYQSKLRVVDLITSRFKQRLQVIHQEEETARKCIVEEEDGDRQQLSADHSKNRMQSLRAEKEREASESQQKLKEDEEEATRVAEAKKNEEELRKQQEEEHRKKEVEDKEKAEAEATAQQPPEGEKTDNDTTKPATTSVKSILKITQPRPDDTAFDKLSASLTDIPNMDLTPATIAEGQSQESLFSPTAIPPRPQEVHPGFIKLQALQRGRTARKEVVQLKQQKATVKIQSGYRGYKARQQVTQMKKDREAETQRIALEKQKQEEEEARQKAEQEAKQKAEQKRQEDEKNAALSIQKTYRGHQTRKSVQKHKETASTAAVKIQSRYRQHDAKKKVAIKRSQLPLKALEVVITSCDFVGPQPASAKHLYVKLSHGDSHIKSTVRRADAHHGWATDKLVLPIADPVTGPLRVVVMDADTNEELAQLGTPAVTISQLPRDTAQHMTLPLMKTGETTMFKLKVIVTACKKEPPVPANEPFSPIGNTAAASPQAQTQSTTEPRLLVKLKKVETDDDDVEELSLRFICGTHHHTLLARPADKLYDVFEFPITDLNRVPKLKIYVYDAMAEESEAELGKCQLILEDLPRGREKACSTEPLVKNADTGEWEYVDPRIELHMQLTAMNFGEEYASDADMDEETEASVSHVPYNSIRITVLEGCELVHKSVARTARLQVKLSVNSQAHTTSVQRGESPEWNEPCTLPVNRSIDDRLLVELINTVTETTLAKATLALRAVSMGRPDELKLSLLVKDEEGNWIKPEGRDSTLLLFLEPSGDTVEPSTPTIEDQDTVNTDGDPATVDTTPSVPLHIEVGTDNDPFERSVPSTLRIDDQPTLHITVLRAEGLETRYGQGKPSDPFVVLHMGKDDTRQTRKAADPVTPGSRAPTRVDTVNPKWNESFEFELHDLKSDRLLMEVRDTVDGKVIQLGKGNLILDLLKNDETVEAEVPLSVKGSTGWIQLDSILILNLHATGLAEPDTEPDTTTLGVRVLSLEGMHLYGGEYRVYCTLRAGGSVGEEQSHATTVKSVSKHDTPSWEKEYYAFGDVEESNIKKVILQVHDADVAEDDEEDLIGYCEFSIQDLELTSPVEKTGVIKMLDRNDKWKPSKASTTLLLTLFGGEPTSKAPSKGKGRYPSETEVSSAGLEDTDTGGNTDELLRNLSTDDSDFSELPKPKDKKQVTVADPKGAGFKDRDSYFSLSDSSDDPSCQKKK